MTIETFRAKVAEIVAAERQAGRVQGLVAGMPVETSGQGRTAGWSTWRGALVKIEGDQVFVDFPGTVGMICTPTEVQPRTHAGCPCAQDTWSRQHHG